MFLFGHIINILLTELGRSVWENLDLGRWYRPHCVRSVLATSVKILPYRPPARLIRAKYIFAEGEVIIGEYSPRLRLGEYSPIITKPEVNNCFSINTQVIISKKRKNIYISTRNHIHLQWQNDYW